MSQEFENMSTKIKTVSMLIALLIVSSCGHTGSSDETQMQNRLDFLLQELADPNSQHVMVAAHRGDWFWAPENSLKGFQYCIEAGVDILEIDVRLSKDRIPMIIHDTSLDRTTTGKGMVADWPLDSLKTLFLKDATGAVTEERIPTLEEVMLMAKGKILIYLDKSYNTVPEILPVLERTGTLHQAIFVSKFPYNQAMDQFGDLLEKVIYVPVIEYKIPDLVSYANEYMSKADFQAYQVRVDSVDSDAYRIWQKLKSQPTKLFVAATWAHHTMGHDDALSRTKPDQGWGWLIDQGFTMIETNRPYDLLEYLRNRNRHD